MEKKYVLIIVFGSAGLLVTLVLLILVVLKCRQCRRLKKERSDTKNDETTIRHVTVETLDRDTHVIIKNTETNEQNCVWSFKDAACASPNAMSEEKPDIDAHTRSHDESDNKNNVPSRHFNKVEQGKDDRQQEGRGITRNNNIVPQYANVTLEAEIQIKDNVINDGNQLANKEALSQEISKEITPVKIKTNYHADKNGRVRVKVPMFPIIHGGDNKMKPKEKTSEKHSQSGESDYLTPVHFAKQSFNNYDEIQDPVQPADAL